MNGYARYAKRNSVLHPLIAEAFQPYFPSVFRLASVRVQMHDRAWWDRFHRTGIWVLGRTVMVADRFSWDMQQLGACGVVAHELFHVWQWHRDGPAQRIAETLASVVRKYTGRHWHSSRFEREAIDFQKDFTRQYDVTKLPAIP